MCVLKRGGGEREVCNREETNHDPLLIPIKDHHIAIIEEMDDRKRKDSNLSVLAG